MQTKFKSSKWLPYLLLSPSVIIVFIFFIIPSSESLYYSFFRQNITGTRKLFVGFENFTRLFMDPEYIDSLIRSFLFTVIVVVFGLTISLGIAMIANKKLRFFNMYRTLLIWPYALSPAITGMIWALMFNPTIGVASNLLNNIFGISFNYINNSTHAMIFICVAAIWKMLGYNIIFFLSGLQNVPPEILEASIIDGANAWRRFRTILLPLISPTTFFLIIMNTLYAFFQQFGLLHVVTEGGPGRATDLLVYKLYRDGFISMNTGYASAQSIILLLIVAAVTFIQFKSSEKSVFYGT
ncbi:MAG: glycerol-3-phosphate ABC transporter permease [Spirochaetaceae bacterium 4572_59]|nr:MAG: glycerol-3-phosphate ABC transporter permease [Spirochaetaceae bacterium 4572_59]